MDAITKNTKVSVSVLVLILGAYGFVIGLSFAASANTKAIVELKARQETIYQMATDIAVIKTKLENIERRLPAGN